MAENAKIDSPVILADHKDNVFRGVLPSIQDRNNEAEIWEAFKRGDRSAFIYIYNQYFKVLYGYGSQFTGNRELVKDLIHDVFVELQTRRERLSSKVNLRFYLLRCYKNQYLLHLKKQKVRDFEVIDPTGQAFEVTLSVEQRLIQEQLTAEQKLKVNQALQQLSPRQKEAIFYYYYQELTIDQIREIMNLDQRRSVQNLIYQAIAELKHVLLQVVVLFLFRIG